MNKDLWKGTLIVVALLVALAAGALLFADNGWRKTSCVARAIVSGVALHNVLAVCGV